MKFDILTVFPDLFSAILGESIIGRAQENNLVSINAVNIRDFSRDKHKKTDDYPIWRRERNGNACTADIRCIYIHKRKA